MKPKTTDEKREGHWITLPDTSMMWRIGGMFRRYGYEAKVYEVVRQSLQARSDAASEPVVDESPARLMVKLFLQGLPQDLEELNRVFRPWEISDWLKARLIECEDGQVTPLVELAPYKGLVIASDRKWSLNAASRPHAVMGLAGSSNTLSDLTIPRVSRLTLDLGTGTGVQAMLAARHSGHVIAVDINPRALDFARFNAQLNGVTNIEFIEGNLFEPVADKKFDLILCNPPYTISPESRCLYRDNPMQGDQFVQQIVRQMPEYLSEGGYGQITCDWEQHTVQPWGMRLGDWVRQSGCDAWVLRSASTESVEYAKKWLQGYDLSDNGLFREWISYFKKNDIASIGTGFLTLRRKTGEKNWLRIAETQPQILPGAGEHIEQGFQLKYFLDATQDNEVLLQERFRVTPHVLLEQKHEPGSDGWRARAAQLTLTRGFAYSVQISPRITELIAHCKGQQTLGELLREMAIHLDKDVEDIVSQCADAVRELVALGFLWPVQHSADQTEPGKTRVLSTMEDGYSPEFTDDNHREPTSDQHARSPALRTGKSSKPNFVSRRVSDFLNRKVG